MVVPNGYDHCGGCHQLARSGKPHYCSARKAKYCIRCLPDGHSKESVTKPEHREPTYNCPGIVYIIGIKDGPSGTENIYKIGYTTSNNSKGRLGELQVGCPWMLYIAAEYEVDDCRELEKHLHAVFDSYRTRGEWFDLKSKNYYGDSLMRVRREILQWQR